MMNNILRSSLVINAHLTIDQAGGRSQRVLKNYSDLAAVDVMLELAI
jgi:hypothetical protein